MFRGSMVALVTPMHEQGDIDFDSLTRLVDFHLENGTDAIVAVGTTGESATLTLSEQHDVIRHVVRQVAGRLPVIAGTGVTATAKSVELTQAAMALGADACLLMTPAYVKPTQEGLYRHYAHIAHAVPIPQILYNVPSRTGTDLLPETVARLAELPNIVGLKDATGKLERVEAIFASCGDRIDLFSGDCKSAKDFILAGGKGVISVTANVVPQQIHDLAEAALQKDTAKATRLDEQLQPLYEQLFVESNPIPVKWALSEMGLAPKGIRLPLTPLSEACRMGLRNVLEKLGVLA